MNFSKVKSNLPLHLEPNRKIIDKPVEALACTELAEVKPAPGFENLSPLVQLSDRNLVSMWPFVSITE
jgi:hypothetical protein